MGALGGALTGGIAAAGTAVGIATQSVIFKAISGTVSNSITSLAFNGSLSGMDVVAGLAGGIVGGLAGVGSGKLIFKGNNIGGVIEGLVAGGVSGYASGFTSSLIRNDGDLKQANSDGWRGAAFGAVQGGIVGGIQAKRYDRNIWTGLRKGSGNSCSRYVGGLNTYKPNQYKEFFDDFKFQFAVTLEYGDKNPLTIFALRINSKPSWSHLHWPGYADDKNFLFFHRWKL